MKIQLASTLILLATPSLYLHANARTLRDEVSTQEQLLETQNLAETMSNNSDIHEVSLLYKPDQALPALCVSEWGETGVNMPDAQYLPGGPGGHCKCGGKRNSLASDVGYVYAWRVMDPKDPNAAGPVKIGCTGGPPNAENPCRGRMHDEMGPDTAYEYICFPANCKAWQGLTMCNAAEVYLQDKFFCQGKWLGGNGGIVDPMVEYKNPSVPPAELPRAPYAATMDGRSEWFDTTLEDVVDEVAEWCGLKLKDLKINEWAKRG